MIDEESDSEDDAKEINDELTADYRTLVNGFLSPRHRRFAQLAAEGKTQKQIGEELGYVSSRVSVLLRHPLIQQEIARLQDRLFEETIQTRLKAMADPALSNIEMILRDKTNRVKISEKFEASKWVVEKLDGKATQKTDIGENLLGVLLDRLDARRTAPGEPREVSSVSPADLETKALAIGPGPENRPDADELANWIEDFAKDPD